MIGLMIPSVFAQNDRCDNVNPGALLMNCDFKGVDWRFMDLSGIDFSGANISDALIDKSDLTNTNFSGANLSNTSIHGTFGNTNFENANLKSANFSGGTLTMVNFSGANLDFANFFEAEFYDTNFNNSSLFGANFYHARNSLFHPGVTASFYSADLSNADLKYAILDYSNFENANLSMTKLDEATFNNADFTNANLSYASICNELCYGLVAKNAIFVGADLSYANLSASVLTNADFENANLMKSDLWQANVVDANMEKAILINSDISEADFSSSNMRNTDVTGANIWATNFSEVNTSEIIGLEDTVTQKWVEGTTEGFYEEFSERTEIEETQTLCGEGTIYRDGQCIVNESGGGCLIATAAFGSEIAPQVQFLREIRDNTVMTTQSGTAFMTGFNQFYYSFSPQIADYERENPVFKEAVKVTLTPLLTSLTLLNYVEIDSEEEMLGYGIGIILLNVGMYFVAPAVLIISLKKKLQK